PPHPHDSTPLLPYPTLFRFSRPAQRHRASGGSQRAAHNTRRFQAQGGKSHTPAEVDVKIVGTRWTEHPGDVGGRAGVHSDHGGGDRKSTPLNSSHEWSSYAV